MRFALLISLSVFGLLSGLQSSVAQSLNVEDCQKLYAKQLLLATKAGPLSRALNLNQKSLVSQASIQSEVGACRAGVSRKLFQCQMAADTFLQILLCQETVGKGRPLDSVIREFKDLRIVPESSGESGESGESAKEQGSEIEGQPAETGNRRATADQCSAAYNQMLQVYANSRYLQEDPDRNALLEYWRSESARLSFQSRCLSRFSFSDARCLQEASGPAEIQQCLSRIPPG